VNILIKKTKHIRGYNYTTEQNLEPIQGALEGLRESLVAYEEVLTVKFRQPSHEFTFGVGMTFVSYPLVLTPVV
jgi:hypothetical protein